MIATHELPPVAYVDDAGRGSDETGDGTPLMPFATVARALESIPWGQVRNGSALVGMKDKPVDPRRLTSLDRIRAFNKGPYGKLFLNCGRIDGTWIIGNDYRNGSTYYGAYPKSFLERVMLLFPDVPPFCILHLFSGSLTGEQTQGGIRVDSNPDMRPNYVADATNLRGNADLLAHLGVCELCIADPPYTKVDAEHYGGRYPNKRLVFQSLYQDTPVKHVVWLDTSWPQHRKDQWTWVGHIQLIRSTNHRVRLVSIFERAAS